MLNVIRWKFVIPTAIITAVLVLFFVVFFDPLLARGIEVVGSQLNGAKVEVDGLKTKFAAGRINIGRLQVANRQLPMKNIVEGGPLTFQVRISELLKKRVIIPEAGLEGLSFDTDRKTSGALPRPARSEDGEKPSAAARLAEKYKDRFSISFQEMKTEGKERIKFDAKDLHVVKQADELKARAEKAPDEWDARVKNLRVEERLKQIEAQLEEVKKTETKGTEAITAIPAALQKLKKAKEDLSALKSDVSRTRQDFSNEVKSLRAGVTGLPQAKQKDIQELMGRLNLDFADPTRLMEGMIGPAVLARFQTALRYIEKARTAMPSKKEKESLPEKPRAKGMDIQFPRPADPPKFWFQKGTLAGTWEGIAASGQLLHFASDPSRIGKPFQLTLNGQKGVQRFTGQAVLDHTGDVYRDSFSLTASGLDAKELGLGGLLGESLTSGSGSGEFVVSVIGDGQLGGHITASFGQLKFDEATLFGKVGIPTGEKLSREDAFKTDFFRSMIRSIEKTPTVSLTAQLTGTWTDPSLRLNSNLTNVFSSVIKESVGAALQGQRKQLEAEIDQVMNKKKAEVEAEISKLQNKMNEELAKQEAKVQEKIKEASGIDLGGTGGKMPIKVPSLDKIFKR